MLSITMGMWKNILVSVQDRYFADVPGVCDVVISARFFELLLSRPDISVRRYDTFNGICNDLFP